MTQENQTTDGKLSAYPLCWPATKKRTAWRHRANFSRIGSAGRRPLSVGEGRDRLVEELDRLGVIRPIISTNLRLRNDGGIYANQAAPEDPGVAVYFTRGGRSFVIAVDLWDRVADNLAAIAASIAAIRGLERWGGGGMVEAAFSGFKSLPGSDPMPAGVMTTREAAGFLAGRSFYKTDEILENAEHFRQAYRDAVKRLHPDATGGETSPDWAKLQTAKAILEKHHQCN